MTLPKTGQDGPEIPDYELLHQIGGEVFGNTWLAKHVMGNFRAVKVVYRKTFKSDHPYEREFSGIKRLEPISCSHPGLVHLLDVGRNDRAGYFYFAMELADNAAEPPQVEGANELRAQSAGQCTSRLSTQTALSYSPKTLCSELTRRGRLPIEECLQLGLTLTSALVQLHKQGFIHRDIKPSNIFFMNGQPKLADTSVVASVTEGCSFVGTEGFAAPEGPGTAQADLYSLGKVLYEISTGKDRTDFPKLPALRQEMSDGKKLIQFNEVVRKACRNDRRKRYSSAEEMLADLELLHSGKSVRQPWSVPRGMSRLGRFFGKRDP